VNADADYRDNARDIYPSINSSRVRTERIRPSVPHRGSKTKQKVFVFCFFVFPFRLHQVQPADESIRQYVELRNSVRPSPFRIHASLVVLAGAEFLSSSGIGLSSGGNK